MNENQPKGSSSPRKRRSKQTSDEAPPTRSERALVPESQGEPDEAELERIAELLPPEEKKRLLVQFASHQGWLPPPAMLREYNEVLPGLAERVVAMPEREQAYRHQFLESEAKRQFKIRRRGQDYALVSVGLVMAFAVFLALFGEPVWAARLVIATLVGVVGIFVTGKWFDHQAEKAEEREGP